MLLLLYLDVYIGWINVYLSNAIMYLLKFFKMIFKVDQSDTNCCIYMAFIIFFIQFTVFWGPNIEKFRILMVWRDTDGEFMNSSLFSGYFADSW